MRPATRVIRAGHPHPEPGKPFHGDITFAATYHTPGSPADSLYSYGRYHNPTWAAYETALAELEGGGQVPVYAVAFASGIAAAAAVFGAMLRPGDVVVLPSDSYYALRKIAAGYFTQMGIHVRLAPTADDAQIDHLDGAKLLWLETPSNPSLDLCRIKRLCEAAHAKGVLVAVDNTTATAHSQQPLLLDADFSVASDTKGLTGHSDLLLGHVAVKDETLLEKIRTWRTQIGAIPGPMEVWLAHRSLGTLDVRLTRQCESALQVAQFLQTHPAVISVRYPGLPSHPGHAIAADQMRFFGSIVSFDLGEQQQAEQFLSACRLIYEATSFGSIHTTAERRARWGGDAISDGFIRMNIGCEDVSDILDDITRGLAAVASS